MKLLTSFAVPLLLLGCVEAQTACLPGGTFYDGPMEVTPTSPVSPGPAYLPLAGCTANGVPVDSFRLQITAITGAPNCLIRFGSGSNPLQFDLSGCAGASLIIMFSAASVQSIAFGAGPDTSATGAVCEQITRDQCTWKQWYYAFPNIAASGPLDKSTGDVVYLWVWAGTSWAAVTLGNPY